METRNIGKDQTELESVSIVDFIGVFAIKSRKLGYEIIFSRPGNFYIYANLNGKPGTLGRQICYGGRITGNTIGYDGHDQKQFEKICRRWYRAAIS